MTEMGERVARRDGATGTGGVFYYFSDHLKTASVITDSAGTIKAESDYYPWGGELQFVNNDSNHYKFTGKERDSETGLDLMGVRFIAASVHFPELTLQPLPQEYVRLTDRQYRYSIRGGAFVANLSVDDDDLVLDYEGFWERVRNNQQS